MIQIDENIFQQGGWVALKRHLDEMWVVDGKDLDPKNLWGFVPKKTGRTAAT